MTKHKNRRRSAAPRPPEPTAYQAQVLRDLTEIATRQPDDLQLRGEPLIEPDGTRTVHLAFNTAQLPERAPNGVCFREVEEFWISVEPTPDRPPVVNLDHWRFLGVAHVMSGFQICLYLDPSRDWDPGAGIRGVLDRLWRWMEDAAADRFRPQDALYHAVGSVAHVTPGSPTVVVRTLADHGRHLDGVYLRPRSDNRLDLVQGPAEPGDLYAPVVRLRRDIPIGAGHDVLADLLQRLEITQGLRPSWPDAWITPQSLRLFVGKPPRERLAESAAVGRLAQVDSCARPPAINPWALPDVDATPSPMSPPVELAAAIVAGAARNLMGTHQYIVLTVPHPNGGPHHLLCLRISPALADTFRSAAANPDRTIDPYKVVQASPRMAMEWCRVSDERDQVTTRRDTGRPVEALRGRVVHIWGVGGLGSWLAEFVVRAGARRVVLHDPGHVTGGLLVRQNYVESDIGSEKDEALRGQLRSIRDDVEVVLMRDLPQEEVVAEMLNADLLIDATVSRAVGRLLDKLAAAPARRAVFAHVATDTRTGTLGLALVNAPTARWVSGQPDGKVPVASNEIDRRAGDAVRASAVLEPYRVFWDEPLPGDEFVPTRGCSVPTFHGSAADLAAVAAGLLNFIAMHVDQSQSGTHLCSLPHSGVAPAHHFIPDAEAAKGAAAA